MNREELAVETEHLDLLEELSAAKASGDPARLQAAQTAIREFRVLWRSIRALFAPTVEGGVATPQTLSASISVSASDAVLVNDQES